jgi:DNA-binding PadR family transcriptional regulator
LRKLEDAGYVTVRKEFQNRKPVSWYALADKDQRALKAHFNAMQAIIRGANI